MLIEKLLKASFLDAEDTCFLHKFLVCVHFSIDTPAVCAIHMRKRVQHIPGRACLCVLFPNIKKKHQSQIISNDSEASDERLKSIEGSCQRAVIARMLRLGGEGDVNSTNICPGFRTGSGGSMPVIRQLRLSTDIKHTDSIEGPKSILWLPAQPPTQRPWQLKT